jgi:hypothetical protein
MLIPPLQLLAAQPQQPETSLSLNASPIGIDRLLFPLLLGPPLSSAIRSEQYVRTPHSARSLTT